jgi:hypothetical protein
MAPICSLWFGLAQKEEKNTLNPFVAITITAFPSLLFLFRENKPY